MSETQTVVESPRQDNAGVIDPVDNPVPIAEVQPVEPVATGATAFVGTPIVGTPIVGTPNTGTPQSGPDAPKWSADTELDLTSDDGVLSDRASEPREPRENHHVPQPRERGGRGGGRGARGGKPRGRGGFDNTRGPGGRGGGRGGGKTLGYYQSQSSGTGYSRGGVDTPTRFQGDHPRSTASLWKLTATINREPAVFIVAGNNPAEARGQLLEAYKSRAFDYTKANLWSSVLIVEGPTEDGYGDTTYNGGVRELFEKGYICRVRTGAIIM